METVSMLIIVTFRVTVKILLFCSKHSSSPLHAASCALTSASRPPGLPASCCGIPEAPGAPGSFFPCSPTSTGKPPDCRPNTSTDSSSPSLSDAARGPSRLRLASTAGLGNTWDPRARSPLVCCCALTEIQCREVQTADVHAQIQTAARIWDFGFWFNVLNAWNKSRLLICNIISYIFMF